MELNPFAVSFFLTSISCLMTAHAEVSIINDDFSSGSIHTSTAGYFGSVGLGRSQDTGTWALRGGSLIKTGTDQRGMGYIVDVSGLAIDHQYNTLNLRFDYTSSSASDSFFVHIYGYQNGGGTPSSDSLMVKLDATKGNAWTNRVDCDNPLTDNFIITNFVNGAAQGLRKPYRGEASGAFEITGASGSQSFDQDLSLSKIVSGGPTQLNDYDYIALVFSRRFASASSNLSIDNVHLTASISKSDTYVDIPEQRTYALLAGLAGLAFVLFVRRR